MNYNEYLQNILNVKSIKVKFEKDVNVNHKSTIKKEINKKKIK